MKNIYLRLLESTQDGVYRYGWDDGIVQFANAGFVRILDLAYHEAPAKALEASPSKKSLS